MFEPAIFISLDLKNWWTWPQDVTFSIMYQIPKIEGKVESISGLIFNIHNRSALDFIRLWSGLYHQLYAAYHMHIKCREPARISSNFRPSKTFRVNKEADFIDEVKGQMLTINHNKTLTEGRLGSARGHGSSCLNQLRSYLWLFSYENLLNIIFI